ncbi:hypothetical protein BG261_00110 [Floricoccus tropicus]|uniref:Uncharacterized protein n=1 Tax=Floricoccus tropicus TaxID=1859473 RepID=A0A1E8GQM3_9LACT|nr:hypothetical protein [Floricoccus tropicus]OFI50326.1 hypothetical protein BG261_00110 [Floricoccus tropicus]
MKDIKVPEKAPKFIKDIINKFNQLPLILKILLVVIAGYIAFKLISLIFIISIMSLSLMGVTIAKYPLISIIVILALSESIYLIYNAYKKKVK